MRTAALVLGLLVAAALAGCTGGSDKTSQIPSPFSSSASGTSSGSGGNSTHSHPHGPGNATLDAFLNVSASNGTAPLHLAMTFGASASKTNLTWALDVTATPLADSTGNATGNATGNQTGNATGNGTTSSTSASSGGGTNATGNETGNGTGTPTDSTVVASFNGTGADLPGNRSVWLNSSASVRVDFIVHFGDNSTVERNATVTVTAVPPGTPLGNETSTFKGSFLASEPVLCIGSHDFTWILNGTLNGTLADVTHLAATVKASGLSDINLSLAAPNGTVIASGPELNATGLFLPGNYTLTAESCVSADASYTITAVASYVTTARSS